MKACQDCIYFATYTILDQKPKQRCSLKNIRIKGNGIKSCYYQKPINPK